DRIVLTSGARIRLTEHALGGALQQVSGVPAVLWREFGIIVPVDERCPPKLDARTDIFQVAVLALSLLHGRQLTPTDLHERQTPLVERWVLPPADVRADVLRQWLWRALGVGERAYETAAEAAADVPEPSPHAAAGVVDALEDRGGYKPMLRASNAVMNDLEA